MAGPTTALPIEAQSEHTAHVVASALVAQPALLALFIQLVRGVVAQHVASGEDLIDLLTLQDASFAAPPDAPLSDYAIAMQVFMRVSDSLPSRRRDAIFGVLWRRVYLQDDWQALSSTANKSDEQVLDEVRGTVAFRTVQAVLSNDSTAPLLVDPQSLASYAAPDAALVAMRFPGMPASQVEQVADALAAEHAAFAEQLATTKLQAFFEQVLTRPIGYVDENDDIVVDASFEADDVPVVMRSIPGAAPVSFE